MRRPIGPLFVLAALVGGSLGLVPVAHAAHPSVIPTVPVVAGDTNLVQWDHIPAPTRKDWLGLYASAGAPNDAFLAWRYTDSTATNGVEGILVPTGTPPGSTYEWRLFSNDGFTLLAKSVPVQVKSWDASAELAAPGSAARGSTIQLDWKLIPHPSVKDWIGLYRSTNSPDASFLAWRYTESLSNSGGEPFFVPSQIGMAPGTYELRLFADDTFVRLARAPINLT